jgi:peptidoglycan/LPS O-acetylase OafA/YrhL
MGVFIMSKKKEMSGLVTGLIANIAVAVFLVLGFQTNAWHLTWMVFLAIPITAIIMDTVVKKKDIDGAIVGTVALIAVVVFMLLGFLLSLWYIAWLVFLAIPITAIVLGIIKATKKDESEEQKQ